MAEPMDASKLLNHMFNDHPKPVKCNENGYLDCQNYCYHKVGQITNGFTLAKPLTNAEGSDVAFGQLMCGLIGKNMDGATVSLRPHFYCQEMRGVYDFDTTNLKAYPGQRFTENLNCQDGKFS
ncbi:hypothetical protein HDE_09822 [Halotydeus destructor]|nr:hypothetical protein HDE_09822 [Halotydeus destructor]